MAQKSTLRAIMLIFFLILYSFMVAKSSSIDNPECSRVISRDVVQNRNSFEIIRDETVFTGWRSVIRRTVRMPNGRVVEFDIIDQKEAGAVVIFAWNSKSKKATIIREYMPGCHKVLGGLAAGLIEKEKHDQNSLLAAQFELEEECHLSGGVWYRLTEEGVSVPMDKYVVTEITAYLVIDPVKVDDPRPLDDEEHIEIIEGVSVDKILDMIRKGDMNLVGGWTSLLAIQKLKDLGEVS